ncbi:MAG: class I SAM-dependent methyltransferase [Myxococcales bacterium]|nr:class I SAM-dependent methyltransferase [Myxococcales bacterium]
MSGELRDRLYDHYVSGGRANAPADLAGLAPRAPYLRRIIRDHFPADRDAKILDVGCGYGALLHFAREAGYRDVSGVDAAKQQVEAAAALGIEGVREAGVLETLAAAAERSLDLIVSFDVMEHFTKDDLLRLVDAVHRGLREGGRWIIHVPNAESPFFGAVLHGDLTHQQAFTRESMAQLLLASGFPEVRCYEDTPVVHGAKSLIRVLLWRLIRAGLRVYVAAETGDTSSDVIFTRNLLVVATR